MERRLLVRPSWFAPFAAVLVAMAALSCGQPSGTSPATTASPPTAAPTSAATPAGTASFELRALAEDACLSTEWADCVERLIQAAQTQPGSIVAICDYGNQTGDVLSINADDEAEAACSAKGGSATRVVGVLHLP